MPTNYSTISTKPSLLSLLSANHTNAAHILERLERLVSDLAAPLPNCETLTTELHLVSDFFSARINENHLDEEAYMYQFILNSNNQKLASTARDLLSEHTWIEECWISLRNMLSSALEHCNDQSIKELEYATDVFVRLKRAHMQQEEDAIFPAAKQLIKREAAQNIAQVLQQRQASYPPTQMLTA